ncbi:MAG: hypothetical protein K9J16_00450 [Melioribacteraceae bacterium]|nr:hypothetical protein [Melioribacteraceae bacterium]MCF8354061.1 hypothetical protein [Melioribacteraceae bacterium]MCF8417758.1 hypothetical protein [Melioribacteraceae bacterium]
MKNLGLIKTRNKSWRSSVIITWHLSNRCHVFQLPTSATLISSLIRIPVMYEFYKNISHLINLMH